MPTPRRLRRTSLSLVSAFIAGLALGVIAPAVTPVQASGVGTIDMAATFNGSSYYSASDNAAFDQVGNMTVEAWIKPAASCMSGNRYCAIVSKENSFTFNLYNGVVYYALTDTARSWPWRATDIVVRQDAWQHLAFAVSRSTNTISVYFNGEMAFSTTSASLVPTTGWNSGDGFSVGYRALSGENFYGDIDEVRLYSNVRTQANIRQDMYTYGTTNATGLVAYYDFNEDSATMVNDAPGAAAGTNLTRTGTVTFTDIKTVSNPVAAVGRTIVTFPRSYITPVGGWTVPAGITRVDALVVAGGGGGGGGQDSTGWSGGGGGAGGLRALTNTTVTAGSVLTVAVGGGGLRGTNGSNTAEALPTSGAVSIFGATSTVGGGYGGMNNYSGATGGSGGGAGTWATYGSNPGSGTSGEGNAGGASSTTCCAGGGGGGAGGAGGGAGSGTTGGSAGNGVSSSITGTATFYAGGGAGFGTGAQGAAGTSGGVASQTNAPTGTGSGGGGGGFWGSAFTPGFGGNGIVIVSYGSTVAVSSPDNSRQFNGASTSNVQVADNNLLDLGVDFTAEAWIHPTGNSCPSAVNNRTFMGKESSFLFAICGNFISYALLGTSGSWAWQTTTLSVSLNTWQHFAFVRTGGRLTIYKNGGSIAGGSEVSVTAGVPTTALFNSTNGFFLGTRENGDSYSFSGYLDDVRLWSYARTASAIALNYDKHIAGDLLYFPFDESGGNVIYNFAPATGATLNGTATSTAPTWPAWPTSTMTYVAGNVYGVLPGYDFETNGAVTFAITQNGTKGTATVSASTGAFSYVANAGATGNDSFTYSVTGVNGLPATYTFTVNAPTQPMTSAKTFRQTADITATLSTASSLGYNNPATAYTLGETVRATVSATNGVINLTQGSTTIAAGAQNSSTITIDGTQSAINTALNSATVTATSPIPTRVTLDIGMKPGDQVINSRTYTWNSNGHYYTRIIPASNGYVAAQSDAQAMSLGGRPGYLATIQHSGENATVSGINGTNSWLGGSDRDLQATYRWKGNDTNSIFRQGGSAYRSRYNNFASGEPNGESGSEDWVEMRSDGLWNDCSDSCNRTSAIIEFDPVASRTITEVDFQRSLAATAQSARSLGLGTSFLNTATWANGEIVRITLTASAGTVAYTAGSTTLVSGSSGSSTVTFEGSVANVNTALNTATVTPSSTGSSTVALTYGVKRATTGSYIYNSTTDHFYLADTTGRNYATTKSTVEARTWAGTNGYMVTVTSEAEHNTVKTLTTSPTWSGGSDATSEGQWEWNSPDAFQIYSDFEVGLAGAVSYFDPSGEPNSSGNYMTINFGTSQSHWDDTGDATYQSITEFSPIDTTLTFNITATSALSISTPSSGLAATNGTAYSLSIAATGGQTPYTYSLASGSLPTGLTLNTSNGTISGTTSGPGTSNNITVRATDANDATATTATFTLTSTPVMCTTSTTVVGRWTVEQVTNTGSCLWTVPTGVTSIDAFVVGAGGGGGADGGGGGGGGGAQTIAGVAVTAGNNLTATIGTGGTGASFSAGTNSTSGGNSTLASGATTIATANGGGGGGRGPGVAPGSGGTSANGFAGGVGGTGGSVDGAAGSSGRTGISNFFLGTQLEYGGGGGGAGYNHGTFTLAVPAGSSGGGTGCGSPTPSLNTTPTAGIRGGGGGAGCAGNSGRPNGASGGNGAVLIRYATDPLDAFPASIGTPAYRYVAENYQTLDSTRRQWIDASGNGRHSVSVSGAPALTTTTGNGSSTTIRTLSGGVADGIRFASFTPTTTNAYTLFHVARLSGATRKRIFDGVNINWLSGYWSGSLGVAYHTTWLTGTTNNGTTMTNWQVMTDQNVLLRQNGITRASTGTSQTFDTQIAINAGYYGIGGAGLSSFDERSDFNAAEVILFNGNLTATQIRQVENYLARIYGLRGFDFNNTDLGANSVGALTASKSGTVSTGSSTQLSLSWTAPQDTTGVTGYKVEYKKTSDSTWTTFAASASGTSSTITGLEAGTEYNTRVTPVDSGATNRPDTIATQTTWGTSGITLSSVPATPKTATTNIIRATVTGAASGTTGTVNFMANGTTITGCATTSVIGGEASCTWTPTAIGSVNLTATFSGDSGSLSSTTASASSVTVTYGACLTSTSTSGRFTVVRITTVGGCEYASLPSGVESVDALVVGGGGGGGENVGSGGGGGGAYYAERVSASNASTLTVIVGAGGRAGGTTQAGATATTERDGGNGEASSVAWGANTFTGAGGSGGQTHWTDNTCAGPTWDTTVINGGTGSGSGGTASTGGRGGQGSSAGAVAAGAGLAGYSNSITGTATSYGGGGGGGGWGAAGGTGGTGGGGAGGNNVVGTSGSANTGGGGGGGGAGCIAGGAGGSGVVILRYANVPTISTQPTGATKSTGQSHTFSVTPSATGAVSGDFTYQWRKDGVNISGATSSSYTINSLTSTSAGDYTVVVKSFGASGAVSTVTSSAATLTMTKANQTITFGSLADRVYGIGSFSISSTNSASLQNTFTSNSTSVCTLASPTFSTGTTSATLTVINTGTCSITASQAGDVDYNAATSVTQTFVVATKALTISGMTAANKEYDAAVAATPSFTSASLVGVVSGDTVTIDSSGATATFANKNVGNGKTVTASGVILAGTHAARYSLTQPTATANITSKALTVTGITANNRVYDRTTSATALLNTGSAALSGVVSGDTVTMSTASISGSFADKTIGAGKTVTISGLTISGTDSGNYTLTQPTTTASITAKELTVTGITANNRVYDGTTNATSQLVAGSAALSGVVSGDTVTLSTSSVGGAFADKTVGAGKTVTISGLTISGADSGNYTLTQPSTTASITAKALTVTGITANNRVYDATNSATALLNTGSAALSGVVGGDTVTLSTSAVTATFATKAVASGKTVFVADLSISGADAANYSLTQPTPTANVTAKELTVTGITANNREYDGTTSATALLNRGSAALSGVVSGDTVTLSTASATATFANKNIGSAKPVTIAGLTISGTDSANYTLTQPSTTADITAKNLTVSGVTANNKVYDQTTTASLNLGSAAFVGVIAGDTVTISTAGATGTFSSKTVATGKTVTVAGITKSGADAGNYTITQPTTTANITVKTLTVTGITAANRGYDGTTSATINPSSAVFNGVIAGDDVVIDTASAIGAFSDANIGTGKTVQISGVTATGTDASNYSITQPTTTADIAAKTLTVSGITATSRVYNGSTSATANLVTTNAALVGIENNDAISLVTSGIAGSFDNKNVGTNKTITISGLTITGANASNYTLVQPTLTTGRITTKLLTVTGITANNKVYDGTTAATSLLNKGSAALSGVVAGDTVTLSTTNAAASFVSKNVGNSTSINISGITISGTDASNYQLAQPQTTANITPKELTVTGIVGVNRVYNASAVADGDLDASAATLVGVVGADDVVLDTQSMAGLFNNKNVGNNKTITVSGLTVYGNDIGNYTLTQPTATANVTTKALTVTGITANNREYDATTTATALLNKGSAALSGVVSGDTVTLSTASATATFATKSIGTNKPVTIAGLTISGTDASNYTLTQPSTTANITAKNLTVTGITANNREYDATNSATALLNTGSAALSGVVAGDIVNLSTSSISATFANKAVGTNKPVTIAGLTISGTDASNYTLTQPSTTANITAKNLTVTGITANNREYDATTTATALLNKGSAALSGVINGDTVTLNTGSATATFANKAVGANKAITIAGITISGTDASNYTLTQPSTSADITAKELTVSGITANNREYDASTSATALLVKGSAALVGVINGDTVNLSTASATATFATKNVGTNKAITIAGITIAGTDAANYTLTQPSTTANITAKSLTVTGITANNREYDATNSATAQLNTGSAALSGVINGDTVTLNTGSATATFANKAVGTNKAVTIAGITISGTDAGNYTLTQPSTTANITAKNLTVTGITASTKVYDGNTTATLTTSSAALSGVVAGDTVTLNTGSAVGTFSSADVAGGKTVAVSGLTISGTDAANYTLTQPTTTADILSATAGLSWNTPSNIVYGTVLSSTQLNATASVAGQFTYTPASGTKLTVGSHTLSVTFVPTNSAYNTETTTVSITVTAKNLTVTGITANNREYDATTSATALLVTGSAALSGVVAGDTVNLSTASATASFANKTIGAGKQVTIAGITISGADASNYTLTQPTTTASITAKELTVIGITADNREYDATNSATALLNKNSAALSGVVAGDTVNLSTASATATFATKLIGTNKTVFVANLSISGTDAGNYTLTQPSTTANITAKNLTVTGITANNREYDASNSATALLNKNSAALSGVISGDTVNLSTASATATFANKAIGNNKAVTIAGITISGADASNYTLTQPSTTANITAKNLTVTGITANNREYDATTSATALLVTGSAALSGVVAGDTVNLSTASATGSFANKTIGAGKQVTIGGITISGADASNYTLTQPTTTASITAKELTVTGITANNREYDATNSATALLNKNSAALSGVVAGDTVNLSTASATATFATKAIGTNKTVFVANLSISGTDAGNYTLTQPQTSADITAKELTVTGITANNREYDATNSATALLNKGSAALSGVISGDTVNVSTASATATFANKTIGTNKAVTIAGITISGADASNYTLTQPSTTANITAKNLTVTGITANNREYDATNSATALLNKGSAALSGVINGDTVDLSTASATATFANKTIGTNKAVTIAGITISGADASNYTLTQPSTTANITAKNLTVTGITTSSRAFNASTSATALINTSSAALSGIVSGDTVAVSFASLTAVFADPNVGTNKPVTISGIAISGTDAGNYTLTQPSATATISQASAGLTWSNPADITFGTSLTSTQLNASAQVAGTFAYSPTSGTRLDAGTHTLTATFTPTSSNYASASTTTSITVLQKSVVVTADNESIVYGASPQTTFSITGLASGDAENAVTFTYAGTGGTSYASSTTAPSNAGTYSVAPSSLTLSTGRLANYSISYQPGLLSIAKAAQQTLTAVPAATTVTFAPAPNKTTVSLSSTGGNGEGAVTYTVSGGDPCTINGTTLTVDGAGSCSVTATKASGANYLSRTSSAVVITINKAAQTLSLDAISSKTYGDSQFTATTSATSGLAVTIAASPSSVCDVPSALTIRIISTGTCTITATQSGDANWMPATVAAGSSNTRSFVVSPKVLTILGATTNNKTYDGSTDATSLVVLSSASLSGIVSNDVVTLNSAGMSASFATKNVANSKAITISGLALAGTHAHRYVVETPTSLTANVTPLTITVSGITVPTRTYDGTNVATLSTSAYTFNGVVNGDSVTLNDSAYTATFASANVSPSAKLVTVSGLQLSGTDAANYTLTQPTLQGFVVKAAASIAFGPSLSAVYNGTPRAIATATQPSSLSLIMSYSGTGQTTYAATPTAPTNAGSYLAGATINDINYQGTNSSPWTITKQSITVQLASQTLSQTFTGNTRVVQFSTNPSGKNVAIAYQGINGTVYQSAWAPTNAGSYQVTATVMEQNFQGTVSETLEVAKAAQAPLSISSAATMRFGTTHQLVALGGSGSGAISYSVLSGPCTVNSSNGVVTATDTGSCVIRATRAESMNYNAVSSSNHTLTVLQGIQTLAFTSLPPSSPVVNSTYAPSAIATSGLTPTIAITTGAGSVCSLVNGTITFAASGLCTITASNSGDSRWLAAASISQTIEIGKLNQTITFPQPATVDFGTPDFTLNASASSGLPVTFTVTQGGSVCSVTSVGIFSALSVGSCTIEISQSGDSTFAAASSVSRVVTVVPSVPSAPHIASISSGDGTMTVGYVAPQSTGGSNLLGYLVTAQSSTAPTVTRSDCPVLTMSCTLVGLVNGASYTVSVAAINAKGSGPDSETAEVLIPVPTISAVRNIVGTRADTNLTVSWEDPNTYGSGTFVHYEVYLKQRGGTFGAPVTVQSVERIVRRLTTQTRSIQFTQLDPSRLYETKIVTITSTASAESDENRATALVMPLSVPSAPRDLTVESPTGTSARISWRAPETDGGNAVSSYAVTSSSGTCTLASVLSTACTITGLQNGAPMTVSVRAINNVGQSIAASTTMTMPTVPGAPTLGVLSAGSTSMSVTWSAPASNGGRPVTAYSVEATEVAQPSQRFRCTSSGLSCVINNLKSSTQYSFTVTATNSVGTGSPSSSVTMATGRTTTNEWDAYRTTTPTMSANRFSLPPAPARVTSQSVGGRRTQVTAVRSAKDADIPVTYALISITTRSNKLLARIKVLVDPQNPTTSVSVPYASSKIRVTVQFANEIGLSRGGPAGVNIAEGNTLEWTTVSGTATLVGTEVPGAVMFSPGSSQLTYSAQQSLKKMASVIQKRGGLVYVTGFSRKGERKSAWTLEPLARARAEATAKYLSRLGVRQWITFNGTTTTASKGWTPINDARAIVTTVYPTQ